MNEYKHIYVEEARRILEARVDRSKWDKAVTEDAIDLLDTVNDTCEQVSRKFAETEEGGAAHTLNLFASRKGLMEIMKNGAENWSAYSWGGCGLVYDADIAEHYCTPSELKKVRGGERRPNSREEWLDVQARALRQAAGRAADALITASHKTYTVNNGDRHEIKGGKTMLFERICGGRNLWPVERIEHFTRDGVDMVYVYDGRGFYINRAENIVECDATDVIKVVGSVYRVKGE